MGPLLWDKEFSTQTKILATHFLERLAEAENNQARTQNVGEMPKLSQQTEKGFKASSKRTC